MLTSIGYPFAYTGSSPLASAPHMLVAVLVDPEMIVAKRLPNEQEAMKGAELAAANAAGLLGDADVLAAAERYGSAVSLAVLSFEESVKGRTLGAIAAAAAQGRAPGFSDDLLRKVIYSGHEERHAIGLVQHVAAAFPGDYLQLMLGMPLAADKAAMLEELGEVVASANAGKHAGFYTDFDPDTGSWSAPGAVTGVEFEKIRALIAEFVAETERQIHDFVVRLGGLAGG
jgi:AbiV family abortive infection protein